jgi:hypothetical protein
VANKQFVFDNHIFLVLVNRVEGSPKNHKLCDTLSKFFWFVLSSELIYT